jgi:pyridoxine 5-phosphate synthase
VIELHTGHYADTTGSEQQVEFERIKNMATYAHSIGLQVNAGDNNIRGFKLCTNICHS